MLMRSIASHFYPRPPGGGRLLLAAVGTLRRSISIHALRVEGDYTSRIEPDEPPNFYPRPPGGGRLETCRSTFKISNFYPRPPGGGRLQSVVNPEWREGFLSTPSGWRATCMSGKMHTRTEHFYPRPPGGGRQVRLAYMVIYRSISIHALRVEGDFRHLQFGGERF